MIPTDERNPTDAPLTHSLIAAAALAAGFVTTPQPAEAQSVIRVCVVNQAAVVIRSRFTDTDWQGTRHTSRWVTSTFGQRNCGTLQDLGSLTIGVEDAALDG